MEKQATQNKPKVKLTGTDGNIFALMGLASRALKRAGQHAESEKMCKEIFGAHSYHEALSIIMKYLDVS